MESTNHIEHEKATFQQAMEMIDRFEHRRALALLSDTRDAGSQGPCFARALLAARALIGLEREWEASRRLLDLSQRKEASALERASALQLYASLICRGMGGLHTAIDCALRAARTAARFGDSGRIVAARAHVDAAMAFAVKRARGCAEAELEHAATLAAADPVVSSRHAEILLMFDERQLAMETVERIAESENGARLSLLGRAKISRILGAFGEADGFLDQIEPLGSSDMPVRVERLRVHVSARRWRQAVAVLDELLLISPRSDWSRQRALQRAELLWRAGDKDEAKHTYLKVVNENAGDRVEASARRVLRVLNKAESKSSHSLLRKFDTVAQLRDHCGPACCELILKHYGRQSDQVSIAKEIKKEGGGTPVYAMRNYLAASGFHVRRVEAAIPLMRRLLDLEVPFILNEEYSISNHVAVAVGYDDEREVLEVLDPMTHEPRETPYEDLSSLLALANDGVILAVPAEDTAKIASLDAIGAVETEYMRITDDALYEYDQGNFEAAEALADQSIAIREDYEFSWICKFRSVRARVKEAPRLETDLNRIVANMVRLWPNDEWPQQYVGYAAYEARRYEEALAAFETARDRDPGDGNNWSMIGECLLAMGRRKEARPVLEEALYRMPWNLAATEILSEVIDDKASVGEAKALNRCALEYNPEFGFNRRVALEIALREENYEGCVAYCDRAIEDGATDHRIFGRKITALARLGRLEEAALVLDQYGQRIGLSVELLTTAAIAFSKRDPARAAELAAKALRFKPDDPPASRALGAALTQLGELEAGEEALRTACQGWPVYPPAMRWLGKNLIYQKRMDEGLALLGSAVHFDDRGETRLDLVWGLILAGYTANAVDEAFAAVSRGDLRRDQIWEVVSAVANVRDAGEAKKVLRVALDAAGELGGAEFAYLFEERAEAGDMEGLPLSSRFVIAVSGVLRTVNRHRFDLLGGSPRPSYSGPLVLKRDWSIYNREDLLGTVQDFLRGGHRISMALGGARPVRDFVGWDLGRLALLMGLGYTAGWVTAEEAWSWMVDIAQSAQLTCGSFEEFGAQYHNGYSVWSDTTSDRIPSITNKLLAPGGAWYELPWEVPIVAPPMPEDPVYEVRITPDLPLGQQMSAAMAEMPSPHMTVLRLVMAPGIYRGHLTIPTHVSLVADGQGVVIESRGESPAISLNSYYAGLEMTGITVRAIADSDDDGEWPDALWVEVGAAVAHDCVFEAADCGVRLSEERSSVVLKGCEIRGGLGGIFMEDGHAIVEASRIHDVEEVCVRVWSKASFDASDTQLWGSGGVGIWVGGRGDLRGCSVHGNGESGLVVQDGGVVNAVQCIFSHGQSVGIYMTETARRGYFEDCAFVDNQGCNVHFCRSEEETVLKGCYFARTPYANMLLTPGAHLRVEASEMVGGQGMVEIQKDDSGSDPSASPEFVGCVFRDSQLGIVDYDAADIRMTECLVENIETQGVVVIGKRHLALSRVTFRCCNQTSVLIRDAASAEVNSVLIENTNNGISGIAASRIRISHTDVRGARNVALYLEETRAAQVTECRFSSDNDGIIARENVALDINESRVSLSDKSRFAILAQNGCRVSIVDSEGTNCFVASDSAGWLVRTTLAGAAGSGLICQERSWMLAEKCTVKETGDEAVYVSEARLILRHAEVSADAEAGTIGLMVEDGGEAHVSDTVITGGTVAAVKLTDHSQVSLVTVALDSGAGIEMDCDETSRIHTDADPRNPWPHEWEAIEGGETTDQRENESRSFAGPRAVVISPPSNPELIERIVLCGLTPDSDTYRRLLEALLRLKAPRMASGVTFEKDLRRNDSPELGPKDESIRITGPESLLLEIVDLTGDIGTLSELLPFAIASLQVRGPHAQVGGAPPDSVDDADDEEEEDQVADEEDDSEFAPDDDEDEHDEGGDDDDDDDDDDDEDEEEGEDDEEGNEETDEAEDSPTLDDDLARIRFRRSSTPLSPEQQWVLAVAAPLLADYEVDIDALDSDGELRRISADILKTWSIYTEAELEKEIATLLETGGYEQEQLTAARRFAARLADGEDVPPQSELFYPDEKADIGALLELVRAIDAHAPERGVRGYSAVRACWLALMGFGVGLFDESTAWRRMQAAAAAVQRQCGSFEDWLTDVRLGIAFMNARDNDPFSGKMSRILDALASDDSPIAALSWDMDFSSAPPPVAPSMNTVRVADAAALTDALQRCAHNDRIVLAAGRYRGPFTIDKDVTLAAEEGPETAIVEAGESGGLVCDSRIVTLRDVSIVTKDTDTAVLARIVSGHLTMKNCTLKAGRIGLAVSKDAHALAVESRFIGCHTTVYGNGAWVAMDRCEVIGCQSRALLMFGSARARLSNTRIDGWGKEAAFICQNAIIDVNDSSFEGKRDTTAISAADSATVYMIKSVIRNPAGRAIRVDTDWNVVLKEMTIETEQAAIDIIDCEKLELEKSRVAVDIGPAVLVRGRVDGHISDTEITAKEGADICNESIGALLLDGSDQGLKPSASSNEL